MRYTSLSDSDRAIKRARAKAVRRITYLDVAVANIQNKMKGGDPKADAFAKSLACFKK